MVYLLSIAIALFAGLMMTRVFKYLKLNLPDVTAFLIAGLLIGPYCLGRVGIDGIGFTSIEAAESVGIITNVALGFIAFAIGNEFRLSQLKKTGKNAVVVGLFEALAATLVVDIVLFILHIFLKDFFPVPVVITLGAIASATAPAATLMVVRQYKAKGPVTEILLPIVALDDAICIVTFAVSFGIAKAFLGGSIDVISVVVNPVLEIICSLLLGALMSVILTQLEKTFFSNSNRLSLTISFVLLTIAISSVEIPLGEVKISFSSLLVCMMLGTIFCNMSEFSQDIMSRADKWTAPLFATFFVISGAELDLGVFRDIKVVLIGIVYILFRCIGKYSGARIGSTIMGCDENIRKYLGVALFPQAGVALGMVVQAQELGEAEGAFIRNIILFAVLIYELAGPLLTKMALTKAGEIAPHDISEVAKKNKVPNPQKG